MEGASNASKDINIGSNEVKDGSNEVKELKDASKDLKDASKDLNDTSKDPKETSKDASKTPKDASKTPKDPKPKKHRIRNYIKGFKLRKQPAGNIVGTVNDAYNAPDPDITVGSYHWVYERVIIMGMVPLLVVPFVNGVDHPYLDCIFGVLTVLHTRYGFESCITDYIPLRVYGNWHHLAMRALDVGSWMALYGVYLIETETNGLFTLFATLWAV